MKNKAVRGDEVIWKSKCALDSRMIREQKAGKRVVGKTSISDSQSRENHVKARLHNKPLFTTYYTLQPKHSLTLYHETNHTCVSRTEPFLSDRFNADGNYNRDW